MTRNIYLYLAAAAAIAAQTGCISLKTEHEVKPIHITMDVNLKVDSQIEKALTENEKPSIQRLIERGLVGLGNNSMLTARGPLSSDELEYLVKANSEYKERMAKVAEENGITQEEALKRAGEKVLERAPAGAWYQDPAGNWQQKK